MVYLLLGLLLLYFLAAGVISWVKSGSLVFLGWMLMAVVIASILALIFGFTALQWFAPETFETQGGGIGFLVFYLPLFLGTGILIGVWSVAWGYWFGASQHNFLLWQGVGLLGSSLVGTVLPLFLVFLLGGIAQALFPDSNDRVTPAILGALAGGCLSPAIVHGLMAWWVGRG